MLVVSRCVHPLDGAYCRHLALQWAQSSPSGTELQQKGVAPSTSEKCVACCCANFRSTCGAHQAEAGSSGFDAALIRANAGNAATFSQRTASQRTASQPSWHSPAC